MDPIVLGRIQFGVTTVYHFFFVPLTLGLSVLVAIMETMYVRSGDPVFKQMTKFWGKLFLVNFAMGVVTGIVQEFQFGMNWSEYSRFVGDIFGAPLAIEALLAFFLESTFLGVWVFGWDKLSRKMHAAAIWLVALGSNISALWILIANSFMQQPVGYVVREGRAEMSDFFALIANSHVWLQFPHVVTSGLTTAAFFVMGISAYHLLKKSHSDLFRRSFKMAALIGTISVFLVALIGHQQAQHMVRVQPMKMAAAEALWRSEDPASFSLITIVDLSQRKEIFSIRLPYLLSLMAYNRPSGKVEGVYDLQQYYEQTYGPGDYIPPVAVTYWSFRAMVGAGMLMILLGLYALYKGRDGSLEKQPVVLKAFVWALFLPYLANTAGWLLTELGRYPWIVFGLLKIEQGFSPSVDVVEMWITLIGFTLTYGLLMVADVYLLVKFAKAGPSSEKTTDNLEPGAPSLVGAQD